MNNAGYQVAHKVRPAAFSVARLPATYKYENGSTGGVYPFARNISCGERVKRSLVCTSSVAVLPAALLDDPSEQPVVEYRQTSDVKCISSSVKPRPTVIARMASQLDG